MVINFSVALSGAPETRASASSNSSPRVVDAILPMSRDYNGAACIEVYKLTGRNSEKRLKKVNLLFTRPT